MELSIHTDKRIKDDLGHFIMPSAANPQFHVVPNFFMEVKAPNKDADVAKRQTYGALEARAIHSLQTYKEDPFYDNKTYTITSIYDAGTGTFELYATHPTQPTNPSISPEYHMSHIDSFVLTSDPDTYRQGITAFRNTRNWAKEQRDRSIEKTNTKARELNRDNNFI
jgi:hypothetical protein